MRPAVDAKLSCDTCNLVNQSGRHPARVQTSGETTLQMVIKRLPGKTLWRNDQGSENHCEGLDFRVTTYTFSGLERGWPSLVVLCERFFHSRKNRACLDDPMPFGSSRSPRHGPGQTATHEVSWHRRTLSGRGFCAEGEVECLTNRMTS
ncbi:hypothetical protein D3C84_888040 [compost metagenome]